MNVLLLCLCAFVSQPDQPASWFNKQAQESVKLCQQGKAAEAMQLLDEMKAEADRQNKNGERALRIGAESGPGGSHFGRQPHAHSVPTLARPHGAIPRKLRRGGIGFRLFRDTQIARGLWRNRGTAGLVF